MDQIFRKIVNHIFSNWTALRLAVEESEGGDNNMQLALTCRDYVVDYCLSKKNLTTEDIHEALEDIMDEEFHTICEDGSPKEIACLLYKFVQLLHEGNLAQCEIEYHNLPVSNSTWFSLTECSQVQPVMKQSDEVTQNNHTHTPMEGEWIQVKTRKKT